MALTLSVVLFLSTFPFVTQAGDPVNVVASVGDTAAVIDCDEGSMTALKWKRAQETDPIVNERTAVTSSKHEVPDSSGYALTINNVVLADSDLYTCEGTDGSNTVSKAARLIVLETPTCEVTDMEFKCEANFGGDWGPLADVTDKDEGAIGTNPAGTIGTSKMTRIQTVTAEQTGLVKCALKMETSQRPDIPSGDDVDNTVPVVANDPKYQCTGKGDPLNVVASVGDDQAVIPCNDDGLGGLKWEKGETTIVSVRTATDTDKHSVPDDGDGYALTILNVALTDGGLYTCTGTSTQVKSTSVSKSARLIVLEKPSCEVTDEEFKCEAKFGGDWGPLADVTDEDGEDIGTNPSGTIETDKVSRTETITTEHGLVKCALKMETSQRPDITSGQGIEDNVPQVPDYTKYQCPGRTSGGAQQTPRGTWLGCLVILLITRWR